MAFLSSSQKQVRNEYNPSYDDTMSINCDDSLSFSHYQQDNLASFTITPNNNNNDDLMSIYGDQPIISNSHATPYGENFRDNIKKFMLQNGHYAYSHSKISDNDYKEIVKAFNDEMKHHKAFAQKITIKQIFSHQLPKKPKNYHENPKQLNEEQQRINLIRIDSVTRKALLRQITQCLESISKRFPCLKPLIKSKDWQKPYFKLPEQTNNELWLDENVYAFAINDYVGSMIAHKLICYIMAYQNNCDTKARKICLFIHFLCLFHVAICPCLPAIHTYQFIYKPIILEAPIKQQFIKFKCKEESIVFGDHIHNVYKNQLSNILWQFYVDRAYEQSIEDSSTSSLLLIYIICIANSQNSNNNNKFNHINK